MIEVSNLVKNYGPKKAVSDISFVIGDGEIVGFLGPNGAGKSTTMNIITGYLSATAGSVKIDGIDLLEDPIAAKKRIGYLPEQPPLYLEMTVEEYLDFVYELKKVKMPDQQAHINDMCAQVGIEHVYKRVIKNLSKGYKQRVGLAGALIGDPDTLILDEPTVGLDPIQIIEIRNVIKSLGKKRTVILSSHILPEVQAVCERVLVISNGKIVADNTPETLASALTGAHRLSLKVKGTEGAVKSVIKSIENVKSCSCAGERENGIVEFFIESDENVDIRERLFFGLAKAGLPIMGLGSMDLSLEDIFLKLTTDDDATDIPISSQSSTIALEEPVEQEQDNKQETEKEEKE